MNVFSSCFLLLLLPALAAASVNDAINWRYKHAMSVLMDIDMNFMVRQKRQTLNNLEVAEAISEPSASVPNDAPTDTARACAKKCEDMLTKEITSDSSAAAIESPFSILKKGFDLETHAVICRKFNESEACFKQCDQPSSSLGVYRLICGKRKYEFISHMPCYQSRSEEPKEVFERTCGGPGVVFSALFSSPGASAESSIQDIGRVLETMRPMCRFLQCSVDYTANALEKRCKNDPTAGKFFREIGVAGAKTALGALEAFDQAQNTHLLPAECDAIINPNGRRAAARSRQASSRKRPNQRKQHLPVAGHRLTDKKEKEEAPVAQSGSVAENKAPTVPVLPPIDQHTLASAFLTTTPAGGSEAEGAPKKEESEGPAAGVAATPDESTSPVVPAASEPVEKAEIPLSTILAANLSPAGLPAVTLPEGTVVKLEANETTVEEAKNGEATKEVVSEKKEKVVIEDKVSSSPEGSEPSVEELQKTVLRKQLNVLERTEAQLELEMKKLQLEIGLLEKRKADSERLHLG